MRLRDPCAGHERGHRVATEGDHDRELEEQDMHSAWFTGEQIEQMILDGTITDAQTIAAWTMLRLAERR